MKTKLKLKKGDVYVSLGSSLASGRLGGRHPDLIVDGMNMVKKHQKPTRATMQGGIIDKEMPIHVSNVALWCRDCGATRIGYRADDAGHKVRVCRKCGSDV